MSPREAILLVYGFIFGTSTPYLKPKNRFLFPTAIFKFDNELKFFLGGSGICAEYRSGESQLVVNLNQSEAASLWRDELVRTGGTARAQVAFNSLNGVFGNADILAALPGYQEVIAHSEDRDGFSWKTDDRFRFIDGPVVVPMGDEVVHFIPVNGCATMSDLVIFFEKRSVMMFGALFSNRIHPQLTYGAAARAERWISTLENLITTYSPETAVPGEGEFGSVDDVREFIRYLKSLTDPAVEFSFCRQNFDWIEIPSATSLEENFDILRHNVKTHTSLR